MMLWGKITVGVERNVVDTGLSADEIGYLLETTSSAAGTSSTKRYPGGVSRSRCEAGASVAPLRACATEIYLGRLDVDGMSSPREWSREYFKAQNREIAVECKHTVNPDALHYGGTEGVVEAQRVL